MFDVWWQRGDRLQSVFSLRGTNVKYSTVLVLLCLLFLQVVPAKADTTSAGPLTRLHPALRAFVVSRDVFDSQGMGFGSNRFEIRSSPATGEERIGVLVKVRRPVTGRSYRGIPLVGKAGTIFGLSVTMSELIGLALSDDVVYIEPAWKTEPKLDKSLPAIRADVVHMAMPSVTGEGIVVGVVDTGIDYTHLDFCYDSDGDGVEESSRILSIWDQTQGLFGARYSLEEIESDIALGYGPSEGSVRQADTDGHGTHVASIAAGDGSSSPYAIVGVAPEAWIVAVKTSFYTSDILAGVEHVFDEADVLGVPAVVNLSLGGHEGPHDGTSLFEQGLDELTQGAGRIVVVSAGNEGNLAIHTSGTLQGSGVTFEVEATDWEVELSLWYPGTSRFTSTITPPSGGPIMVLPGTDSGNVSTSDGVVYVDNAAGGVNPNNGDREVFIRLSNVNTGSRWRIAMSDVEGGGRFDAWVTSDTATIVGGDSVSTIDEPGNARGVITVGSFNSKAAWPSLSGEQDYSSAYPVGALSSFSSHGPTRDGRTKPELCAPGAWICAALSYEAPVFGYLAHPDGEHGMDLGTSMSAPHVAGGIALLLSLDARLTTNDVREALTSTARSDVFTGSVPTPRWGWGKLDVAEAVEELESSEPIEPPIEPPSVKINAVENPVVARARFAYEVPRQATSAELRVYDVSGRLVFATELEPAGGDYDWNLRTASGERLAAGLYLYVLVTDRGASAVGRLVIER